MSTLRDRIAAIEAQSYADALERLQAAMDTLERELALIECGPIVVCRLDDVEVKEQRASIPLRYPRLVRIGRLVAFVAATLAGAAIWYGIIWALMAVWPGR